MNRRRWVWLVAVVALTLLVTLSAPPFLAQDQAADTPEVTERDTSAGEAAVEQILRQQEALITGQGFSYNPEGRRDPFRSPFAGELGTTGKRPPGLAGMPIPCVHAHRERHDQRPCRMDRPLSMRLPS